MPCMAKRPDQIERGITEDGMFLIQDFEFILATQKRDEMLPDFLKLIVCETGRLSRGGKLT